MFYFKLEIVTSNGPDYFQLSELIGFEDIRNFISDRFFSLIFFVAIHK